MSTRWRRRVYLAMVKALSAMLLWVLPERRKVLEDNLHKAYPKLSPVHRRRLAEVAGPRIVEGLLSIFSLGPVEARGLRWLDQALAEGRGVLVLTQHSGPHQRILRWAGQRLGTVFVIGRPLPRWASGVASVLRRSAGVQTLKPQGALAQAGRCLARGLVVIFVLDQHTPGRDGCSVPFFGHPAQTSRGLAWLAARTGAPVIPAEMYFGVGGRAIVRFYPRLESPGGGSLERQQATAEYTRIVESMVRRRPAQWLWTHRRWKLKQ